MLKSNRNFNVNGIAKDIIDIAYVVEVMMLQEYFFLVLFCSTIVSHAINKLLLNECTKCSFNLVDNRAVPTQQKVQFLFQGKKT